MVGIIAILIAYAVFMCLYITSGAIRYNIVFSLLFTMLGYMVLIELAKDKMSKIISLIVICFMLVQNFYSIDIVTNYLFDRVDLGNTKILCIAQKSHQNPGGDYYVTNLQYRTISRNFEKMFQKINLTEKDVILIAGENYVQCNKNASLAELNGRHSDLKWDIEEQVYKNVMNNEGEKINVLTTNSLWGLSAIPAKDMQNVTEHVLYTLDQIQGKVYVYFSPLFQSEQNETLMEQLEYVFKMGEMQFVETQGNKLYFCELYPKSKNEIKTQFASFEKEIVEVDQQIKWNRSQQEYAVKFKGDRKKTRLGDTLAVSIACYENDKFLNLGYSPKGTVLTKITLGNGNVFEEVETSLLGVEIGETVYVTVDFPKVYRNCPEVAGKTIKMEIVINSIERELPNK